LFAQQNEEKMTYFGFKFGSGGAHAARTIMLGELEIMLSSCQPDAPKEDYEQAVIEFNVLDKSTAKARKLTFRHMVDLYGLDGSLCLFRNFRHLWFKTADARPVLALQLALARDPLLRTSVPFMLAKRENDSVVRQEVEELLAHDNQDRFSAASLKSFAQNINGSWTQAGYLVGRNKKVRTQPIISPSNAAFALFMGYLEGRQGGRLLGSDWVKVLGISQDRLLELARTAATWGVLALRQTGDVIEIVFPDYMTTEERAQLSE
jgi:hypothetical protein